MICTHDASRVLRIMGMLTRRPRTIILTHQDDLTQMLGRHPDLMHESVNYRQGARHRPVLR